jgi:hypothetical protein
MSPNGLFLSIGLTKGFLRLKGILSLPISVVGALWVINLDSVFGVSFGLKSSMRLEVGLFSLVLASNAANAANAVEGVFFPFLGVLSLKKVSFVFYVLLGESSCSLSEGLEFCSKGREIKELFSPSI